MRRYGMSLLVAFAVFTFSASRANALCLLCSCSLSSGGINFSTYDPLLAANTNVTGNIRVTCGVLSGLVALGVSYGIQLSAGGSGSFTTRQLSKGASKLNYNLYVDSARTTVWGDGSGATQTVDAAYTVALGAATYQDYTVYGRVPMLQNVAAGAYTDSLVVTINY